MVLARSGTGWSARTIRENDCVLEAWIQGDEGALAFVTADTHGNGIRVAISWDDAADLQSWLQERVAARSGGASVREAASEEDVQAKPLWDLLAQEDAATRRLCNCGRTDPAEDHKPWCTFHGEDAEPEPEAIMLKVGGKPFRCHCGANVLTRLPGPGDRFKCNGCGTKYTGEPLVPMLTAEALEQAARHPLARYRCPECRISGQASVIGHEWRGELYCVDCYALRRKRIALLAVPVEPDLSATTPVPPEPGCIKVRGEEGEMSLCALATQVALARKSTLDAIAVHATAEGADMEAVALSQIRRVLRDRDKTDILAEVSRNDLVATIVRIADEQITADAEDLVTLALDLADSLSGAGWVIVRSEAVDW